MRIAFAGASGTGKTTLMQRVSVRLGLPINDVGSRSVAATMGFTSPYDVDRACLDTYRALLADGPHRAARTAMDRYVPGKSAVRSLFQEMLLDHKIAWEAEHDVFVTDRTVADNLVYLVMHNAPSLTESYLQRVSQGMKRYDHVFFTPVREFQDLAGDRSRWGDTAYHQVYDWTLRAILDRFGVPVFDCPHLPPEERADWVIAHAQQTQTSGLAVQWSEAQTRRRQAVWDALPDRVVDHGGITKADITFLAQRADGSTSEYEAVIALRTLARICEDEPRWLPDATPLFERMLNAHSGRVRVAAIEAIWQSRAVGALPALAARAKSERNDAVLLTLEHVLRVLAG